jgi:hypothetical protein
MAKASSPSNATALRDETVLRRVRQLGSARDGLREWRLQRLTAIAHARAIMETYFTNDSDIPALNGHAIKPAMVRAAERAPAIAARGHQAINSIGRGLMEALRSNGGRIWASATEFRGAVLQFVLPVASL